MNEGWPWTCDSRTWDLVFLSTYSLPLELTLLPFHFFPSQARRQHLSPQRTSSTPSFLLRFRRDRTRTHLSVSSPSPSLSSRVSKTYTLRSKSLGQYSTFSSLLFAIVADAVFLSLFFSQDSRRQKPLQQLVPSGHSQPNSFLPSYSSSPSPVQQPLSSLLWLTSFSLSLSTLRLPRRTRRISRLVVPRREREWVFSWTRRVS